MKYKMPIALVIASALLFLQIVASDDCVSPWLAHTWHQDAWGYIKLTQDPKSGLITGTYSGDHGGKIFDAKIDKDCKLVGKWSRDPTVDGKDGGNLKLEWIDGYEGKQFEGDYDYGSGGLENPFGTAICFDC